MSGAKWGFLPMSNHRHMGDLLYDHGNVKRERIDRDSHGMVESTAPDVSWVATSAPVLRLEAYVEMSAMSDNRFAAGSSTV